MLELIGEMKDLDEQTEQCRRRPERGKVMAGS